MDSMIVFIVIGLFSVACGIYAILVKNLVTAIIAAGGVSLSVSILYLFLAAPDVALTEAAIGSGLATFIFFYALNRVKKEGAND